MADRRCSTACPRGCASTPPANSWIPAAESVERAVLTLERRRAADSTELSGTVRVSTGECAAGGFNAQLGCEIDKFTALGLPGEATRAKQHLTQEQDRDREADMALRHHPPESGDFLKAGIFACAVYRRRGSECRTYQIGSPMLNKLRTTVRSALGPAAELTSRVSRSIARLSPSWMSCILMLIRLQPLPAATSNGNTLQCRLRPSIF